MLIVFGTTLMLAEGHEMYQAVLRPRLEGRRGPAGSPGNEIGDQLKISS